MRPRVVRREHVVTEIAARAPQHRVRVVAVVGGVDPRSCPWYISPCGRRRGPGPIVSPGPFPYEDKGSVRL